MPSMKIGQKLTEKNVNFLGNKMRPSQSLGNKLKSLQLAVFDVNESAVVKGDKDSYFEKKPRKHNG
jgi:hypothetical protein